MTNQTDDIKSTLAEILEQYLYEVKGAWYQLPSEAVNPIRIAITEASTRLTNSVGSLNEAVAALQRMIIEIAAAFGKTLTNDKTERLLEECCFRYSLDLMQFWGNSRVLETLAECTYGEFLIKAWIKVYVLWIGTLVTESFCKCIEREELEEQIATYEYDPSKLTTSDEPYNRNAVDDESESSNGTDNENDELPEDIRQLYLAMCRQSTTWLHLPGWKVIPCRESINRAAAAVGHIYKLEPLKTAEGHQVLIKMIMELGKHLDWPLTTDDAERWLMRYWDYYNDYDRVMDASLRYDIRWWKMFVHRIGALVATELSCKARAAEEAREAALEAEVEEACTPGGLRELLPEFKNASIRRLEAIFAETQSDGGLSQSSRLRLGKILVQESGSLTAQERGPGGDCFLLVSGKRLLLLNGFNCWTIVEDEGFTAGTLLLGTPHWEVQDHMIRITLTDTKEGQIRFLLCWYGSPDGPLVANVNQSH